MKGAIKVKVSLFEHKAITLSVLPQMTVGEITQLVLAAKSLHGVPAQQEAMLIPRGLQSRKKHLLLDYLLTTQETPLIKIEEALDYIQSDMIAKMVNYISKRAPLPDNYEQKRELQISTFYEAEKKSRKETDAWECFEYLLFFDQECERSQISRFPSTSRIQLRPEEFKFVDNRAVSKRTIESFADMESILKMKQALIFHKLHHIQIFQEIVELRESKEHFHFIFNYVPSISLSSLSKLNLPPITLEKIKDKVWIFITNMRSNRYEYYLSSLVRNNSMKRLFDRIAYDIKGNLFVDDFTLVLQEEQTASKMEFPEEQKLLLSIHNYFDPILDPQTFKLSQMKCSKGPEGSEPISLELFVKVFEKSNHQLNFSMTEAFKPASTFFEWKAETMIEGRWKQMNNAHEASTVKKPPKMKKPESSSKKQKAERNQSAKSKSLCRKTKSKHPNISDFVA